MSGFRLLPLGVGDAFSARYYSSSFALEAEGQWLLVDSPHPIRRLLRDASATAGLVLDVAHIRAVVLTHLHADHASGLEGIGFFSRYVLGRRMPLITLPAIAAELWPRHLAAAMEWSLQRVGEPPVQRSLDQFFEVMPLQPGQPLALGPFVIHGRPTIHNIPTVAVRIEAAGRTLGYSADTAFDPGLIHWLADADLVVHEASGGFMHTAYDELAALPEPLRRKLRLIHYPDDFDVAHSTIDVLREGHVCTI
jgi:ribonuclease BN (tRNA processing enzyme)